MTLVRSDVAVVGGGPAALAAAAACAEAGLDVVRIGPSSPWTPTYGCWFDELEDLGLTGVARAVLPNVTAVGHRPHRLARTYAVVDDERLAATLRDRAPEVRTVAGFVVAHRAGDRHRLRSADGSEVETSAVIDATGHAPALVWRPPIRSVAVQSAFGIVARTERRVVEEGGCLLMDWTAAPDADPRRPTFLYALDLGEGWTLFEETALAAAPAMGQGELKRRLQARLDANRWVATEVRHEERVTIPMNLPVPGAQPVIGFGAAGGFVHPATGYSLLASLRLAPRLAESLAVGLDTGRSGRVLADAAWAALWPTAARRTRALHDYGLGVLLGLDQSSIASFFDTFFALDPADQRDYVDPVPDRRRVIGVMRRMFSAAPWAVRRRLMSGDLRTLAAAFR